MKKIILILFVFAFIRVNAQMREGTIKYSLTISSPSAKKINPMAGTTECVMYFKKGKSLSVSNTNVYKMTVLTNEKGMLTLMDMRYNNQRWYMQKTKAETDAGIAKMKPSDFRVVNTNEKKTILGYPCTKTFISMGKNGMDMLTAWCTDKIKNLPEEASSSIVNPSVMHRLKGLPLEIEISKGPVSSRMIVTGISEKPVPDAVFNITTAGYIEKKAVVKK